MVNKQSPIVHVQTQQMNRMYPRHQSGSRSEYGDVVLILLFCFVMYGLFLYYFVPAAAPASYQRVASELGYQWQAAWQPMRYFLAQVFLSLSHIPVLGDWVQSLITLITLIMA